MSSSSTSSCDGSGNPSPPAAAASAAGPAAQWPRRQCRDVFWLVVFLLHLLVFGAALALFGLNRFRQADRFNIGRYANLTAEPWGTNTPAGSPDPAPAPPPPSVYRSEDPSVPASELTETYWKYYGAAGAVGAALAWAWLAAAAWRKDGGKVVMRTAVHCLTAYLAVEVTGLLFARFPFTMLVLQKAVRMVRELPDVMRIAYAFVVVMLCWMALWSFGVSGIVAFGIPNGGQWWLLLIFSVSLFWTGAVLSNTVHVIVSGMVFLVLIHGGPAAATMPPKPLLKSLQYAVTTSFGSICYGSLFTAAIRTLRWEIRGIRSKIGSNECLLCCIDFLFHIVETLVRFFNKYAYVQIAVNGQSFNRSARDAWELFQSTGIESLVAYDCSGAILLMSTILGGLITGTCMGVWTYFKQSDKAVMVGSTSMLMGMILVSVAGLKFGMDNSKALSGPTPNCASSLEFHNLGLMDREDQ
ncbi:unnamed protein product [Miscanthus lutarioriparius]|uniref:Choline transporter-like protein n=1 Tax=Miscanthus lutarioriparius TaxID=422564 RepID=A0A811PMF0_9POAL|nr:unnamed protein product [Miscanthus lutarioriparius]